MDSVKKKCMDTYQFSYLAISNSPCRIEHTYPKFTYTRLWNRCENSMPDENSRYTIHLW